MPTHFTPRQLALRWSWHVESVRRKIRQRQITAIHIGGRVLVTVEEIEELERDGTVNRIAIQKNQPPTSKN